MLTSFVILAASDDSTILDAVKSARKYGVKLMIDLIGVPDMVKRAKELEKLGADYLCIHVGIDEQMQGKKPLRCSLVSGETHKSPNRCCRWAKQ